MKFQPLEHMQTALKSALIRLNGLGLFLGLVLACQAGSADIHFDLLQYRTGALTNVTVFTITKTDICVSHSRGLTSIKLTDLDAGTLRQLGLNPAGGKSSGTPVKIYASSTSTSAEQSQPAGSANPTTSPRNPNELVAAAFNPMVNALKSQASSVPLALLLVTLGIFAVAYLFMCYCLKLIVAKTGTEPGFLIWVPILQWLPLFQAAGMSGLWLLGFLVPILNLVTYVMWSVKIVQMREKNGLWTLLLILPVTNLVALLYLAFSAGPGRQTLSQAPRPHRHPALPQRGGVNKSRKGRRPVATGGAQRNPWKGRVEISKPR